MKSRLLLYLLLLPALLTAQPYAVRQLGIEKGLSNNYVVSIAQDKEGFLWFADVTILVSEETYEDAMEIIRERNKGKDEE